MHSFIYKYASHIFKADSRLLGALCKTVSTGGGLEGSSGYERINEMHLSVFHSAPNRARGKRSRNSISSAARYAFNSFFFCLEQESLRHSRYMI